MGAHAVTDWSDELATALRLGADAGALAMERFGRPTSVRNKPGGAGPVSDTDLAVDALLTAGLREAFADDRVVSEESPPPDPDSKGRVWYVDPIDGTREYLRGRRGWAICIGLCVDGRPVLGVITQPARGWTAYAICDGAAVAWGVDADAIPDDPTLAPRLHLRDPASAPVLATGWAPPFSRANQIRRRLGVGRSHTRQVGSVALRIGFVARGDADVYAQAPGRLQTWDTCAAHAVAVGAGAVVTDLGGDPLDYRPDRPAHARGILVAGPSAHARARLRLGGLLRSGRG